MEIREAVKNWFSSKYYRLLKDKYDEIKALIDEHAEYMSNYAKEVVTSNWYKNIYATKVTVYTDKVDEIWHNKDWPFQDDEKNYLDMCELHEQIKLSLNYIEMYTNETAIEISDSFIKMEEFANNGCTNFFKLIPIGYKVPSRVIYCYSPNVRYYDINVIPFLSGNIYTSGINGDRDLMTSKNAKIFANNYKVSSDFTFDELERIYIPRRIEMEGITNEIEAKEFIAKMKKLFNDSMNIK